MGLDSFKISEKKSLEGTDTSIAYEHKWGTNSSSQSNDLAPWLQEEQDKKDIQDILNIITSMGDESPLFTEQEAGKATINEKVEDKDSAKLYEDNTQERFQMLLDDILR